ncbi:choice-of-anchor D domain-containing protein [Luteolibacter flavescens]|uniref:Choice-of-anchor D domain-containing protein n=1 Tax=Luteolibacter flavescens TaxID=1859460 RepID=A0ABT3FTU5_9BACT|nr:choice-of-anchor D domain-containing protein [Luteolibacter flavescens]MCW1887008.1 choice-of-anchor D domain-containing protein [Luteolibacter flavescens]
MLPPPPSPLANASSRIFPWKRALLVAMLALATGTLPAGAAAIPYSKSKVFHSTSASRQNDTRMGISAAIGQSLVVLGAPYDNVGGEDSGVVWVHDAASGAMLHRLDNPIPAKASYFGWSVAVSGSLVVVGVPEDNSAAVDAGIAYVYNLASPTPAVPAFTLSNPSPARNDGFGWSVAISGSKVIIGAPKAGAPSSDAGRAYVYDLGSATPTSPVVQIDNPAATINFGSTVAIEGNTVAASAIQETGTGDTCRVHVYNLASPTPALPLLTLADSTPTTNDHFGHALAISGTRVVATAPLSDNGADNSGSAYIYDLNSSTPATPVHTLQNPTAFLNDNFGNSVAISGTRLVVGISLDDLGGTDAGVACVYDLGSGSPTTPVLTIQQPGAAAGDEFGQAVSLHGSRLLVTAPDDNSGISSDVGTAYVFDLASGTPSTALLTFNNSSPSAHEEFGYSVAIHGNLVAVGCQKDDKVASNAGSVSLFNLGSATPELPWLVIDNPAPTTNDYFGTAVAVSGTKVVVSAYQDDTAGNNTGTVYIYDTTGPTPGTPAHTLLNPFPHAQDQFGNAIAITGNIVVVGCAKNDAGAILDSGSVYIYDLASATPTVPVLTIDHPSPMAEDWFGHSVAISGSKVVVGANGRDAGALDAGTVYIYDIASTSPTVPIRTLNNPTPAAEDEFGFSVGISGNRILVGCPYKEGGATDAGAVYLYDLSSATPGSPVATLVNPDPENEDYFGMAVGISGTRLVVGVPESESMGTDSGCGYVYEIVSATFPIPADKLTASTQKEGEQLGFSVAIEGENILMGAPLHDANTSGRGAVYLFDPDPPAPQMQVEHPAGTSLVAGEASIQFGNVPVGSQGNNQVVTIRNVGTSQLDVTTISISGGNAGDFTLGQVSLPAFLPVDGVLQFNLSFTAPTTGTRLTTLTIGSNASVEQFDVALTGQALSPADDTDGDGINDVAELALAALGFDWQVNDEELVLILRAGANAVGLYGESQVEQMHPGTPVIAVHPGTGRHTLTLPLKRSVNLSNFELYPVTAPAVTIGNGGVLQLDLTPTGPKGFFRIEPR